MSQYFDRAYQYLKNRMGSKMQGSRRTNPSLSDEERTAIENLDIDAVGMKFIEDTEGYFPKVYDDRKGSRSKKGGESDFGYINPTKRWMFNYPDTGGHATIGYGKLIHPREVKAGIWNPYLRGGPASMTREEARKILRLQVEEHLRRAPLRFFEKITRVPTQNQLTALASIIFNTGGNTKKVKKIIAAFNAGDDVTAARLLRVYSGFGAGGLPKRRFNEGELYEKGTYGNPYRKVPKEAIANWKATGAGPAGGAVPQKKKGPPVLLLGDSNTTPHRRFWKAWIAKQFGRGTKVVDKATPGITLSRILKKMKDADGVKGVIIGSAGGPDVTAYGIGKKDIPYIEKKLRPDGPYYQKHVVPLMSRLKGLQDKGTKIIFYGLPFGRGVGKKCKNNTPVARQKMDELLAYGAGQYNIPYNSVFEETRAVKGKGCGVHYGSKQYGSYRDALRSKNPNVAPLAEEEKDYAQSVIGGKKIKIASGGGDGRWLGSYKYIQTAGITMSMLYRQFAKVYGTDWAKTLLPKHGADRVFGPEHFAAMVAMAKKTNNNKLMAMLMKRSSFRDPVIAKAEQKAVEMRALYGTDAGKIHIPNKNKKRCHFKFLKIPQQGTLTANDRTQSELYWRSCRIHSELILNSLARIAHTRANGLHR